MLLTGTAPAAAVPPKVPASNPAEAMQNYIKASQGTPAQMYPQQVGPMPSGGNIPQEIQTAATGPNYGEMFKAGTSQYASPQLQAAAYKLLEPITTKEGETVTQRNLGVVLLNLPCLSLPS